MHAIETDPLGRVPAVHPGRGTLDVVARRVVGVAAEEGGGAEIAAVVVEEELEFGAGVVALAEVYANCGRW